MMDNPYPICENCIFVDESLYKEPCKECIRAFFAQRIKPNFVSKLKPITNADRIRSMSDEELEDFLDRWGLGDIDYSKTFCSLCDGQFDCHECRLDWLRKEVKE